MDTSYSSSADMASGGAAAALLAFMGVIWLLMLAVIVVALVGMWKVFVKAGKPGWAAIVPIYNLYILLEIVGRPAWWMALLLLSFVPVIGSIAMLAVMFIIYWDLAKSFGKDIGFAIGLVFLSPVFMPILGFGSAQYIGPMASGFGLPDTPGGGTAAPGGYAGGGYQPPAQGYAPPAPPAAPSPTYQPPAPPAAPPAAPPTAPPAAPPAPPAPPTPPA